MFQLFNVFINDLFYTYSFYNVVEFGFEQGSTKAQRGNKIDLKTVKI